MNAKNRMTQCESGSLAFIRISPTLCQSYQYYCIASGFLMIRCDMILRRNVCSKNEPSKLRLGSCSVCLTRVFSTSSTRLFYYFRFCTFYTPNKYIQHILCCCCCCCSGTEGSISQHTYTHNTNKYTLCIYFSALNLN